MRGGSSTTCEAGRGALGPHLEQPGARSERRFDGSALSIPLGPQRPGAGGRASATEAEGNAARSAARAGCRSGPGSGAVHGSGDAARRRVDPAADHHLAALPNPLSPPRVAIRGRASRPGRVPPRSGDGVGACVFSPAGIPRRETSRARCGWSTREPPESASISRRLRSSMSSNAEVKPLSRSEVMDSRARAPWRPATRVESP